MIKKSYSLEKIKSILETRFEISLKLSSIKEIKHTLFSRAKTRALNIIHNSLDTAQEDLNHLFLFKADETISFEPYGLKEAYINEDEINIRVFLSQEKFTANEDFYDRNKDNIIALFLSEDIAERNKYANENMHTEIIESMFNFFNFYAIFIHDMEDISRHTAKKYRLYYNRITEEDLNAVILESNDYMDKLNSLEAYEKKRFLSGVMGLGINDIYVENRGLDYYLYSEYRTENPNLLFSGSFNDAFEYLLTENNNETLRLKLSSVIRDETLLRDDLRATVRKLNFLFTRKRLLLSSYIEACLNYERGA